MYVCMYVPILYVFKQHDGRHAYYTHTGRAALAGIMYVRAGRPCLLHEGPRGNKWLRHRFWYALYDYNMIFSNVLVGIAVMTTRFVVWAALGIFCLGRIDLCLMPGPGQMEFLDFGYRTYVALIRQDHRYNNPCLLYTSPSPRDQRGSRMPSSA